MWSQSKSILYPLWRVTPQKSMFHWRIDYTLPLRPHFMKWHGNDFNSILKFTCVIHTCNLITSKAQCSKQAVCHESKASLGAILNSRPALVPRWKLISKIQKIKKRQVETINSKSIWNCEDQADAFSVLSICFLRGICAMLCFSKACQFSWDCKRKLSS